MSSLAPPNLPVIDLTKENLNPGTDFWESVSIQVCEALENNGCFIAKYANDDSLDLHNAMFDAVEDLFNLPHEKKLQNKCDMDGLGYFPHTPSLPLFEAFGVGDITTLEGAQKFNNIVSPNGDDKFFELAFSHAKLLSMLYKMVMRMVFESYGVEKHYQSHIDSTDHRFGFIKYSAPKENQTNVGRHAHMDKSFADILDQNYVKGLEVKTKDGEWIDFEPTPSHFVFLAGEALMAWSNGRIHSPYHRVIIRGNEPKYTIPMATYVHGIVETPEEFVDEEHPLQFKPFSHSEFLRAAVERMHDTPPYGLKDYCGV